MPVILATWEQLLGSTQLQGTTTATGINAISKTLPISKNKIGGHSDTHL